jgi:two-component system chemotaxis response regulator CheB
VAIGCSTGGPQALLEVLPAFPPDFPAGIVIVQHMPKSFTKPFAERINALCELEVKEAEEGDDVRPGRVLIAPGGVQCRVRRKSIASNVIALSPNVEHHLHAPSVDIMMQSVASVYEERGIGIILTGMGHDGLDGMKAIKAAKGRTIAQDEQSSIVYGMPKAVVDAGCADKVIPLSGVVGEILNMV